MRFRITYDSIAAAVLFQNSIKRTCNPSTTQSDSKIGIHTNDIRLVDVVCRIISLNEILVPRIALREPSPPSPKILPFTFECFTVTCSEIEELLNTQ